MPTKDKRKIYKHGDSHVVSIPRAYINWMEENYETKKVDVEVNGDQVIITPASEKIKN